LIGPDVRVLARKYGRHADDQWSVSEVINLARDAAAQWNYHVIQSESQGGPFAMR
jgi:hypothetical protein